jgi:iron complex outermembrane receptor protein
MKFLSGLVVALIIVLWGAGAYAQTPAKGDATPVPTDVKTDNSTEASSTQSKDQTLTDMSLENLTGLNVMVTSSAKKAESLRSATSAIYVITQEDIQRSGARYLPDLLAMVPGVQVNRQSADEWSISARGFNAQYNDKMLVLVDGRSVFDPNMGGVAWNEQDVPLDEIERIEVIRGPGGTLWGSNAVNGVVNIITKDSKSTQGLYLSGLAGSNIYPSGEGGTTSLNGTGSLRYGGKLSDDLYYRIYGQANNQNPSANPNLNSYDAQGGTPWHDAWYDFRAGFRMDLHADQDQLTLEGEAQKGYYNYARLPMNANFNFFNPYTFSTADDINTDIDQNAHVLLRWTRDFKDDSQIQVMGYYDYNNLTTVNDARITNVGQADIEFQHRFHLLDINEITWGGSFRNTADDFFNQINIQFNPGVMNLDIYSGFVQDKVNLIDNRLYLTGGVKLENNQYTQNEWQPTGRLLWTPDETNSVWAAYSRAVRIPVPFTESANVFYAGIPAGGIVPGMVPPTNLYAGLIPNTNILSEVLNSYELGYRTNPTKETSIDLAAFINHYDNLISFQSISGSYPTLSAGGSIVSSYGPVTLPGPLVIGPWPLEVIQTENTGTGNIYGIELSGQWKPVSSLKVNVSYTYQTYDQGMINASNMEVGAPPPHNLANARIYFDPDKDWELNTSFYYTDATFAYDPNNGLQITPDFVQWNLGASYKPADGVKVSVWGLDLEGKHWETLPSAWVQPAEVVPSVYGEVSLQL